MPLTNCCFSPGSLYVLRVCDQTGANKRVVRMNLQGNDDTVGAILLLKIGEVLRVADRCLRILVVCYDVGLVTCQQSLQCKVMLNVPICKTTDV